jgi:hypothetical protein
MHIDETFKRRIRIEGALDVLAGYKLTVTDIETGEMIWNVLGVVITICPGEVNRADVTYHNYTKTFDENGPVFESKQIRLDNPEIAVSCYERCNDEA